MQCSIETKGDENNTDQEPTLWHSLRIDHSNEKHCKQAHRIEEKALSDRDVWCKHPRRTEYYS